MEEKQKSEKPVRTIMTIPADLHRILRASAAIEGRTMNDLVIDALSKYVQGGSKELNAFVDGWLQHKRGLGVWEQPPEAAKSEPVAAPNPDTAVADEMGVAAKATTKSIKHPEQ
jgi:hypothetical protein